MPLSVPSHHPILPLRNTHSRRHNHHLSPFPNKSFLRNLSFQEPKPFRGNFVIVAASSTTSTSTSSDSKSLPNSAIKRIAEKLRSLGFVEEPPATDGTHSHLPEPLTADSSKIGEIFLPSSHLLPKRRVGHTLDPSWSTPENPVPEPATGSAIVRFHELRGELVREKKEWKEQREENGERSRPPTLADLTLPPEELRRLRTDGIWLKNKLKIGKAGITEGVVNNIHERWRGGAEVVKIVCEDVWKLNMRRTHELLERKTGGMVVWRAGSKIVLYRGVNYKFPYFTLKGEQSPTTSQGMIVEDNDEHTKDGSSLSMDHISESAGESDAKVLAQPLLVQGVGSPNKVRFQLPGEKQLLEEAGHVLEGLGPRFTDWWGCDPLPVDADLLPAVVPGYRKPFRLLPYGLKPKLTNDEMTVLKRLGRPLPCHFVLGRNRKLQGLAAAMVKLWERSEIAKIAVKRGVQNMNSELMAEELKSLTGGTLISRDKDFIVFYRGKDFLPLAVSSAIEERRKLRFQTNRNNIDSSSSKNSMATDDHKRDMNSDERKMRSMEAIVERTNKKLSMTLERKAKAENLLNELEEAESLREADVDKEGITEDEKYMLRRVGLRMKPFLLLGRRGVFDGTVENMHLHWKYRELVKILCSGRNIEEVRKVAHILETESGGILVAVERVRKGFEIIIYRGKNYQRPAQLRPTTLLNKKEALRRSLEAQRRESLKLNVLKLTRNVEHLQGTLANNKKKISMFSDKQSESQPKVAQQDHTTTVASLSSHASVIKSASSSFLLTAEPESKATVCSPSVDKPEQDASSNDESTEIKSETSLEISKLGQQHHTTAVASLSYHASDIKYVDSSLLVPIHETKATVCAPPLNKSERDPSSSDESTNGESTDIKSESSSGNPVHDMSEVSPATLSNKERLVLRRQALKMTKCPKLAIGKSNVVYGLAKAIKDHFKKHPLVIVNVKGRARGTSVQEVVSELERLTGGILVSREPSKVILYRGWGKAGQGSGRAVKHKGNIVYNDKSEVSTPKVAAVSPELIAAMRLECGI